MRPLPPLPALDPLAELSPLQQDDEVRASDPENAPRPDADLPASGDTRWALDLGDPYAWH